MRDHATLPASGRPVPNTYNIDIHGDFQYLHNIWNYINEVFAYNYRAPYGAALHTRAVPTENNDYSRVTVFSRQYADVWDEGGNVSFCICP